MRLRPPVERRRLENMALDMNDSERERLALELLKPLGFLLNKAIDAYVGLPSPDRRTQLMFGTAWDSSKASIGPGRSVVEIVEDLLLAKKADGLSARYIETLRAHLRRFASSFKVEIQTIKAGPRARNNMRASIVTLFHFARKHNDLPKAQATEADDVSKAKDRGGKIGILTPYDLARVLGRAPEKTRLFIALGAFTGMRSSEILRLDWREVNFARGFITVSPEKAKTATRRLVPILPNTMQWLANYRNKDGLVFSTRRDADKAIAFAKGCGIRWPNNALRHSYATYRLAATADAARVALEMGNSPQKLMRNYRELADESEAEAWFSISPDRPENIIPVGTSRS
jgi:integrase